MPIELAECTVANDTSTKPAFAWWVTRTLRRRDNIINSTRVPNKLMIYGIKIPGSVEQAYAFGKKCNNQLWTDAVKKEMINVIVAFGLIVNDEKLPIGSKFIPYHVIFDPKASN